MTTQHLEDGNHVADTQAVDITTMLGEIANGNTTVVDMLVIRIYQELHQMAACKMRRERKDHTMQAVDLVQTAVARLIHDLRSPIFKNRAMLFSAAARVMEQVLIDYARYKNAETNGGHMERHPLSPDVPDNPPQSCLDVERLHNALQVLRGTRPQEAQVLELRYLAALKNEEIADMLKISLSTVEKKLKAARNSMRRLLHNERGE